MKRFYGAKVRVSLQEMTSQNAISRPKAEPFLQRVAKSARP